MGAIIGNFIDLTGQKFGRLTVVERAEDYVSPKGNRLTQWLCKCDCGNYSVVNACSLRSGATKSCGCINRKHGMTKTRLYNIWVDMRQRCYNGNYPHFHRWGGKGVVVCEEWKDNFQAFAEWALKNGYDKKLSLDRINGNGNYEPCNCRWATAKEQARNTVKNRIITIDGVTKPIWEWIKTSPITESTYYKRIKKGMSDKEALFTPSTSYNGFKKRVET